jgi:hypothetical protein
MYVNGGSPPDLVWVAETAKRYTHSTLNTTGRDDCASRRALEGDL